MTQKNRLKNSSASPVDSVEFNDFELRSTMRDFLQENEQKNEPEKDIWNFSTVLGLGILFIGMISVFSFIGISLGGLVEFANTATSIVPFIGGVLVTLIGFGFFVGDRKRVKKYERKLRMRKRSKKNTASNSTSSSQKSNRTERSFSKTFDTKDTFGSLRNDLDSDFSTSSSSYRTFNSSTNSNSFYKTSKKLMKSRSDKKIAGICGGLAAYFGISSTVIRLLFGLGFFVSGTSVLIYLGLFLAMPKEPLMKMDDFEF
jgi:phage shock protein C